MFHRRKDKKDKKDKDKHKKDKSALQAQKTPTSPSRHPSAAPTPIRQSSHAPTTTSAVSRAPTYVPTSGKKEYPMPSTSEVERQFDNLLERMNPPDDKISSLRSMSSKDKWSLILAEKEKDEQDPPANIIKTLKETADNPKQDFLAKVVKLISTRTSAWVDDFLDLEGPSAIFEVLQKQIVKIRKTDEKESDTIAECCRCVRAVMDTGDKGFNRVVELSQSIRLLTFCLDFVNIKTRAALLQLLAAAALSAPDVYRTVSKQWNDTNYSKLIKYLSEENTEIRAAAMMFINTLINEIEAIDDRVLLRSKFMELGLESLLLTLFQTNDQTLLAQLQVFKETQEDDATGGAKNMSPQQMVETIQNLEAKIITLEEEKGVAEKRLKEFKQKNKELKSTLPSGDEKKRLAELEEQLKKLEDQLAQEKSKSSSVPSSPAPSADNSKLLEAKTKELQQKDQLVKDLQLKIEELEKKASSAAAPVVDSKQFDKFKEENENLKRQIEDLKNQLKNAHDAPPPPPPVDAGPPPPPPVGGGPPPPPPPVGGGPPPPPPPGGSGPPPPPAPGGPPPPPAPGGPPPPPGPGGPPPPPGPGGGPPPPFGAPKAAMPKKRKRQPAVKMKGFMWTKLADNQIKNTIWEKTNDDAIELDEKTLEQIFGVVEKVVEEGTPKEVKQAPKHEEVSLIDPKRSNSIQIMLRGLKLSPPDIKNLVLKSDTAALDAEKLQALIDNVPTSEEITTVKGYSGDPSKLAPAEKFVLQMIEIPRLENRLRALLFKATFEEKFKEVETEVTTVREATAGVDQNPKLISLLELILALGNFLNGSTPRGGIYGFKLNSLLKMMDTKANDNKSTLLHYLVSYVELKKPELLELPHDLKAVHDASKVSFTETQKNIRAISAGLKTIEAELKQADDTFKTIIQPFYDDALKRIEALDKQAQELIMKLQTVLVFFGEKSNSEPDAFFLIFSQFFSSMETAKVEAEKRKAEEQKLQQKARFQEELKKKTQEQGGKAKGHLSMTIARMKSGRALSRRNLPVQTNG